MNLVAPLHYKMQYVQKALAQVCPHRANLMYCKLCQIDTIKFDFLI